MKKFCIGEVCVQSNKKVQGILRSGTPLIINTFVQETFSEQIMFQVMDSVSSNNKASQQDCGGNKGSTRGLEMDRLILPWLLWGKIASHYEHFGWRTAFSNGFKSQTPTCWSFRKCALLVYGDVSCERKLWMCHSESLT